MLRLKGALIVVFAMACVQASSHLAFAQCVTPGPNPDLDGGRGWRPGNVIKYGFSGTWEQEQQNGAEAGIEAWGAFSWATFVPAGANEQAQLILWRGQMAPGYELNPAGIAGKGYDAQGYLNRVTIAFNNDTGIISSAHGFGSASVHEMGHTHNLGDMFGSPAGTTVMNSFAGADDQGFNIPEMPTACDINAATEYNFGPEPFCDAPTYPQPCFENDQLDEMGCCVPFYCPLVMNLAGQPIKFSSAEDGVDFDLGAVGTSLKVAWPVSAATGWLVCDFNGNGRVDDGSELFGTATRHAQYANGFEALLAFDTNRDGWIDSQDAEFRQLAVWVDANRNGQTDAGEVKSLDQAGVRAISLAYRTSARRDRCGNYFRYSAVVVLGDRHGVTWIVDVFPRIVR